MGRIQGAVEGHSTYGERRTIVWKSVENSTWPNGQLRAVDPSLRGVSVLGCATHQTVLQTKRSAGQQFLVYTYGVDVTNLRLREELHHLWQVSKAR